MKWQRAGNGAGGWRFKSHVSVSLAKRKERPLSSDMPAHCTMPDCFYLIHSEHRKLALNLPGIVLFKLSSVQALLWKMEWLRSGGGNLPRILSTHSWGLLVLRLKKVALKLWTSCFDPKFFLLAEGPSTLHRSSLFCKREDFALFQTPGVLPLSGRLTIDFIWVCKWVGGNL